MTTKELLEVLSRTKSAQMLEAIRNPPPPPEPPPPPVINWEERRMKKNKLLKKYTIIFTCCFATCLIFIALPINLADSSYGKGVILGLPPILFMTLSWVLGAWWAWDKETYIFLALTMGGIPFRLGFGVLWVWFVAPMPGLNMTALVMSMMAYWIMFTVIEISMIVDFGNRLPRNGTQIEEIK
jgi:hypothetical protein